MPTDKADGQAAGTTVPEDQPTPGAEAIAPPEPAQADEQPASDAPPAEPGTESPEQAPDKPDADATPEQGEPEAEPGNHRKPGAERRIDELTAKLHDSEGREESLRSEIAHLREFAQAGVELHPSYLSADQLKLVSETQKKQAELNDSREWYIRHMASGYTHPKDPSKNLTPEEVADRLVAVDRELRVLEPRTATANAIFDAAQKRQLEDMDAGRQLREAAKAAKVPVSTLLATLKAGSNGHGKPAPSGSPAKTGPATTPGRPGGASGAAPVSAPAVQRGINLQRFETDRKVMGAKAAAAKQMAAI